MIRYGFELEGFAVLNGSVIIPPASWPTDGFPGLVEIRNTGGGDLYEQFFKLFAEIHKLPEGLGEEFNYNRSEFIFSGADISYMRKHRTFSKDFLDVKNLYGKEPRRLGNKTLASFQISVSNQISEERKTLVHKADQKPYIATEIATYGLLDVGGIVKRLDDTFAQEIKESGRQKGMYSLKGDRLEYRSLPNTVVMGDHKELLKKIKNSVEPKER